MMLTECGYTTFVIMLVAYLAELLYTVSLLLQDPCTYMEPAAHVTRITDLELANTEIGCDYEIQWNAKYAPWWSPYPTTESIARNKLRLPCPPDSDRSPSSYMDGCYTNSRDHPEFTHKADAHYFSISITTVRILQWFAASPLIPIVVRYVGESLCVHLPAWIRQTYHWILAMRRKGYDRVDTDDLEMSHERNAA